MKKLLSVLMVVVLLFALSATAFAQVSPGSSPIKQVTPPVVKDKEVTGEGTTADGAVLKVVAWDPEAIPEEISFKDEKEVVEDAVKAEAFEDLLKELKVEAKDLVGSSVLMLDVEDEDDEAVLAVVVIFYDGDGKPVAGMYFYEDEWYPLTVEVDKEANADDAYVLVFGEEDDEDAVLVAEVKVTIPAEK